MITEVIKVVTDTGDSEKKVRSLGNSISEVGEKGKEAGAKGSKGFSNLGGSIEGISPGLDGAINGMKGMLVQMTAILANPLGLALVVIVGSLTLLFKAFTSTNEGGKKLDQIMAGLGATVDVLRDRFLKLVSLDFKGAFSGVGDEISKEFKEAANLAKALQEVADASRDLGVSRAKLNRDLASSKELITDETASYSDKKKAIDNVRIAEGKQTEQELANAQRKLKAIIAENKLSDTLDEGKQKQADAETAVFNLQKEQSDNKRAFNKLDKKADSEEKGRLKEITDAKTVAFKERLAKQKEANKLEVEEQKKQQEILKSLAKEQFDAEQNLLKFLQDLNDKTEEEKLVRQKERADAEIETLKQKGINVENIAVLNAEKFATLENELAEKRRLEKQEKTKVDNEKIASDKKIEDEKQLTFAKEQSDRLLAVEQAYQDAKRNALDVGLNILGGFAGKNKALALGILGVQKGLAISDVVVNATKSIATQTASAKANIASTNAFYALGGPVGAGIATAQNIKTLASLAKGIVTTKISAGVGIAGIVSAGITGAKNISGGGGGAGADAGSGGGGSAPSFNLVQGTGSNQIASSISGQNRPIQAFVVSSNVTTAQSLDRNIISNSKI